uniref:Uncharacterized protein n=1 Tax=Candidatus Kentrum sp. MB TaxID=2138164 RepID=A0A450X323_9GAMM|nr:MAG: hypothetical protein BECKMB1821G_GA0114241_100570 [Candidatus Kentron sp. MB]VFK27990.1 MAG: hypothetical protein BECKMB1821I_GA0114274_100568 [Candidatus Kentron sp. MB]VFK74506.1 MAG: hypothetical protein BECKMB1821H_GA0114242_100571 [Candidatus Kentron sp. MB]
MGFSVWLVLGDEARKFGIILPNFDDELPRFNVEGLMLKVRWPRESASLSKR